MATRQNFDQQQREFAYEANARWLKQHRVDGIMIALEFESLRTGGLIFYCENCLFCHTDRAYFDVDHLVPDRQFKVWQKHIQAKASENMMILCKSLKKGDYGCNQCKGAKLYVPVDRGLAYKLRTIDMNCCPLKDRPFSWRARM